MQVRLTNYGQGVKYSAIKRNSNHSSLISAEYNNSVNFSGKLKIENFIGFNKLTAMMEKAYIKIKNCTLNMVATFSDNFKPKPKSVYKADKVVNGTLYRCHRPDDEIFQYLKKENVKTIIDLRRSGKKLTFEELKLANQYGIKYVKMPLTAYISPTKNEINKFFELIEKEGPVCVHCRDGKDRTGVMVAAYRIAKQGWTFEKAFQEMKVYGHKPKKRFAALKSFLENLSLNPC